MQVEVKKVTGIIQPIHQKAREVAASVERVMPKHVSSDLVENMQKIEEEVLMEKEKFLKIMEDFQTNVSTSHSMEE